MVATPSPSTDSGNAADVRRRIDELNRRLRDQLRSISNVPDEAAMIDRMRRSIVSRRVRLERLEHEAAALVAEITRLEDEVHGREKALALLLGTVVTRIERATADAWSPVPVVGYRLWAMREGALHGARTRWEGPRFDATCEGFPGDAPHSDGTCGRLGCGVYATKELRRLLDLHVGGASHSYVGGVTTLSGKVVEHEHGYRAAHAEVVAVYAVWPDRTTATSNPAIIDRLFTACDRIPASWCDLRPPELNPTFDMIRYLEKQAKEAAAWI